MPKVSVLMPVYNGARFLPQAIGSVLSQSFGDFEFLIVNDGSTDRTENILSDFKLKDGRVIYWSNAGKLGVTESLNRALAKARGEFVARIDSDDAWASTAKLQKQLDYLDRHPDCGLVGAWAEVVDDNGKKLYDFSPPSNDWGIRKEILAHNCFIHSGILARKQNMLDAGGYGPGHKYAEDYALWLKMGTMAKFANLPEILVRYRVNTAGITQTKNLRQISAALDLVSAYQKNYPGRVRAKIKWRLQRLFTAVLGPKNLLKFKQ